MKCHRWLWVGFCSIAILSGIVATSKAFLGGQPKANPPGSGTSQGSGKGVANKGLPSSTEEEKSIRAVSRAFSAALNKADLESLMKFWTEDAEYIRESGEAYRNRTAIRALLKKAIGNLKGYRHEIRTESIRFVTPTVGVEAGVVQMTSPEGVVQVGRHETMWVKKEGKWLITRVRDLPSLDNTDKPVAYQRLKSLSWLVGDWEQKGAGAAGVHLSCRWGPGQTFLLVDYSVKQGEDRIVSVSWRIGWDPSEERIRSWTFDTNGGFGGAWWNRVGNSWQLEFDGYLDDGKIIKSTDGVKFVNENTTIWTSKAREADEQPLPDLEITFTRKAKK